MRIPMHLITNVDISDSLFSLEETLENGLCLKCLLVLKGSLVAVANYMTTPVCFKKSPLAL